MFSQEEKWLLEEKYESTESEAFRADLALLHSGTPLAFLIGSIPFLDCTIHLDSHPLIPRPETEFWTVKAIQEIKSVAPEAPHILDLCAGSGAIGVALAKTIPDAEVDFVEIDHSHFLTIKKNITENVTPTSNVNITSYKIMEGNLFEKVTNKYNFILSNPPYIDPALDRTDKSVKEHEPDLALYGGNKGLELIRQIITESPKHLNPNGQLWLEHEPEQSDAIKEIGETNNFFVTTHKDQYGKERYSVLVLQ